MKVFVVMEIGWEYNDENYFRPEDKGGIPRVAYESKIDANIACAKMNADELAEPGNRDMVTDYDGEETEENPDGYVYIKEFFEVKEVELYCE